MANLVVGAKRKSLLRRPEAVLTGLLVLALAAGITGLVVGAANSNRADDVWFEVAKAGLQLLAVGLLGGAVAYAFKALEQRRADHQKDLEQQRYRNEQRLVVFGEIVAAYNRVKAVRRILRSLGFRDPIDPLSADQAHGFHDQMLSLNDVQLSFEARKRELAQSALFTRASEMIAALDCVEHYLSRVLKPWEDIGWQIGAGTPPSVVAGLELDVFIGDLSRSPEFQDEASAPLRSITKLMHEELFEPPVAATVTVAKGFSDDDD